MNAPASATLPREVYRTSRLLDFASQRELTSPLTNSGPADSLPW
jgi:hypothetical protein